MPRPVWLRIELPKLCAGRYGDALAVLAGAASVAAFAPFGLWPLAPLALATLTWLCLDLAPRRAFWRGFWFGVGQFAFGIHWIYFSVRDIGQAPLPLAVGLLAALVVAMALFPALCMALARQRRWPVDGARFALLVLPAAWTFIEWTRGWFLGGFPWLALGYAHLDTPLAGYAPLLGVYGVSWAVALTAGGLLLIARSGTRARVLAATVLLVVWGGGWWANGVRWTHPAGPPIEVALVQGNIRQELKWLPEQFRPTLERYFNLSAAHLDADLIVWPEAAVPALYHWVADTVIAEADALRRAGDADLLFGVLHHEPEGDRYYNAVLGLGDTRAFYFKRHLVPFGEFFPVPAVVREWLRLMNLPYSDFTAGAAKQPLLELAGWPLGVSICYEAVFGEELIADLPQAALLVNVSNDAWFGDSIGPHQHFQIARMRARETERWLLRATNTGITAAVDPSGRSVAQLPQFEAGVLRVSAEPRRGATPYVKGGNVPVVLGLLLALAAGLGMRRGTRGGA